MKREHPNIADKLIEYQLKAKDVFDAKLPVDYMIGLCSVIEM
jgi:hypothetical protein